MFFRRTHTIILATFDCVARLDLRAGKSVEVVRASRVNRSEHVELGSAVRTGLGLGPIKSGRVYVLSDELWSGRVSLDNEIVDSVTEDQLEQTLSLEAEYESGISPFDSRLGHALITSADGQTTWWVTQADSAQLDAITAAVAERGGRLAAISAIAALPSARKDADQERPDITSSDSYEAFAQAWLSQYLSDERELPVIGMTSQSWTRAEQQRIGVLSAATVLAICVALHVGGSGQLTRAHAELSQLVAREKQVRTELDEGKALAHRIQEAKRQRETAEKVRAEQLDELHRKQAAHAARRKRPVQLLRALAATADPGHWVQGIDLNDEQVVISGVAVGSTSVTTLAQRLESELDPSKWLFRAAEISISESARLVHFEITIVPLKEVALPLNVASSGATDAR